MYRDMFAADALRKEPGRQNTCATTESPCWIPNVSNFIPKNDTEMNACSNLADYECMLQAWLPDGYSQIACVWPFGLLDYGSAMLHCKI